MSRPERLLTVSFIGVLLAVAAFLFWRSQRTNPDPLAQAIQQARAENRSPGCTPEGRHQRNEALYQQVLARHPGMIVTHKNVPDERNGFLKWVEFEKKWPADSGNPLDLPSDISEMKDSKKWDATRFRQWSEENKALIDEIAAIGLMPDQSIRGIDLPENWMLNAGLAKRSADLLCLQARLVAEQGNEREALRSLQAACGLANHLDQIETPCILHATVVLLARATIHHCVIDQILPALPAEVIDWPEWQKVVGEPALTSDDLARYFFGEWHISLRYLTLPIFTINGEEALFDPERFIDAWADLTQQRMHVCRTTDWTRLRGALGAIPKPTLDLTEQAQGYLDITSLGTEQWGVGHIRCQCNHGLQAAALAILQGKPVPNEPITGLPYVWDAGIRTLSVPADARFTEHKIEPLILKELKK